MGGEMMLARRKEGGGARERKGIEEEKQWGQGVRRSGAWPGERGRGGGEKDGWKWS